jgi:transcriptional regulator with XRE-family HTH domain
MTNIIGNNIRRFRELRDYSQDYMADKLDITQSSYGKIEREAVNLTFKRLQCIANILEIDLANLINPANQNIFNQYNNETAIGHIENQRIEMREAYEKLMQSKDEQIALLKEMLDKK